MTNRSQADKATLFRALHAGPDIFVIPNPWDAGSARILTALGFKALATTSAGFTHALGRPDGDASRDETLANAAAIVAATELPVSADLENGFGHAPEDAALTIRMAHATGLVGGSIEDASGDERAPIYDFDHAVARVTAAVAAARACATPFVLTARAENFLHGRPDLDDTIARLQAFEAAGADVFYAPGLPDLDAIRRVCGAVSKPVNVLAGASLTVDRLAQAGVRRVSLGSGLSRAALGGMMAAAREILDHGSFTFAASAPPYGEVNAMMVARG